MIRYSELLEILRRSHAYTYGLVLDSNRDYYIYCFANEPMTASYKRNDETTSQTIPYVGQFYAGTVFSSRDVRR